MKSKYILVGLVCAMLAGCVGNPNYIKIKNREDLHKWFRYSQDRNIVISGHRGGMVTGYPENCIESFEKTLTMMPSFFEIDPRLTKDSVIVLMHDATLDRTTTGHGKLSDYTYAEIQELFLKDREGNVTPYKIPTLEECIVWSQGKTILNLDIKDVPIPMMSKFINKLAPANLMYTVHNGAQAREYLEADSMAMFSCWCKTTKAFDDYEKHQIPWGQVMAYVGVKILPENQELYDMLHAQRVMCMTSLAPTHDTIQSDTLKIIEYKKEVTSGCDVIETDYPYLFQNISTSRTK